MEAIRVEDVPHDNGVFYRKMLLPEEERLKLFPGTVRPGYRWFRSENVVAIEHFRRPQGLGQKAGRFGWL